MSGDLQSDLEALLEEHGFTNFAITAQTTDGEGVFSTWTTAVDSRRSKMQVVSELQLLQQLILMDINRVEDPIPDSEAEPEESA